MPKYRDEWWHTDAKGRRIGWLYPDDLQDYMNSVYGEGYATARRLALDIGVDASKVSRWLTGKDPIPKTIAMIVALAQDRGPVAALPGLKAPWLPATDSANGRQAHDPAEQAPKKRGRPPKQAQ